MTPVVINGRLLADGGPVNPLPIAPTVPAHEDLTVAVAVSGQHRTLADWSAAGRRPAAGNAQTSCGEPPRTSSTATSCAPSGRACPLCGVPGAPPRSPTTCRSRPSIRCRRVSVSWTSWGCPRGRAVRGAAPHARRPLPRRAHRGAQGGVQDARLPPGRGHDRGRTTTRGGGPRRSRARVVEHRHRRGSRPGLDGPAQLTGATPGGSRGERSTAAEQGESERGELVLVAGGQWEVRHAVRAGAEEPQVRP